MHEEVRGRKCSHTQVDEEVLRLLLAAAPRMDLLRLANYLHTTLANSRR